MVLLPQEARFCTLYRMQSDAWLPPLTLRDRGGRRRSPKCVEHGRSYAPI